MLVMMMMMTTKTMIMMIKENATLKSAAKEI
jgi:hypothetical protein